MKINKKQAICLIILVVICIPLMFFSCSKGNNALAKEADYTKQIMDESINQIGMPAINEFFEKKMVKTIFELRDKSDLINYLYSKNEMTGKFVYIGKCIGYGLPYGTQFTSPSTVQNARVRILNLDGTDSDNFTTVTEVLPQADPNGLYPAENVDATWVMYIDETTGKSNIMYFESDIIILQTKLPKRLCEDFSIPSDY